MNEKLCILMDEIERIRIEMHNAAIQKGLMHAETVRISQLLDKLIIQHQKQIQNREHEYSLY